MTKSNLLTLTALLFVTQLPLAASAKTLVLKTGQAYNCDEMKTRGMDTTMEIVSEKKGVFFVHHVYTADGDYTQMSIDMNNGGDLKILDWGSGQWEKSKSYGHIVPDNKGGFVVVWNDQQPMPCEFVGNE